MVGGARGVLVHQAAHGGGVEQAARFGGGAGELFAQPGLQLAPEPGADGRGEALFVAPRGHHGRQQVGHGAAQTVFGLTRAA